MWQHDLINKCAGYIEEVYVDEVMDGSIKNNDESPQILAQKLKH